MKILIRALFLTLICVISLSAQDDETRQSMDLPMKIGENVTNSARATLSGKVTILGMDPTQTKPNMFVVIYLGGSIVDRRQVSDSGNYFVPNVPRQNAVLAIEVNSTEIGRYTLIAPSIGGIRQDISFNWTELKTLTSKPGVVAARTLYKRTEENEKLFVKAAAASKDKNPKNAIGYYKELLKSDPKDFVAWTELGTLYFRNDKLSDAESAYVSALEQDPHFFLPQINLGKLYLAQKQPEKAIDILGKAVENDPGSADANHYLGEAYLAIKKGSKAVVYLNEALKLAPVEKAEIHLRLGALYDGAGLKDRAVEEYKMFLSKVPDYPSKNKIEKYIKENS
ncbi:MAG: tetratricopeptide repeat protein [Acidobacteria bacterium]|nr:tetratricopeptide repeat protein [Acidobacteriota bacterium]